MSISLTDEQLTLSKLFCNWYKNSVKQYFSYSGAAGTGKTTVIRYCIDLLGIKEHEYICCALTGKAVQVLTRNGLPAKTIHSLIYQMVNSLVLDEDGNPVVKPNGSYKYVPKFVLRDSIPECIKLIVVDEATMVNDQMKDDLLSFGRPVVFIGDMNQLPPVFGVSSVMLNPDFVLTKIMRQAEGNPIVYLSQNVLKGKPFIEGQYGSSIISKDIPITRHLLTDFDIILSAKNKTRSAVNDYIRSVLLMRKSKTPVIGDKVICRQNNWQRCIDNSIYLTNGMIGTIDDIEMSKTTASKMLVDFKPEFTNSSFLNIELDYKYIKMDYEDQKEYGITPYDKFEYGYVITTHLSQGSQYSRVLFMDEYFWDRDYMTKLRYTGITRAIDSVFIGLNVPSYVSKLDILRNR